MIQIVFSLFVGWTFISRCSPNHHLLKTTQHLFGNYVHVAPDLPQTSLIETVSLVKINSTESCLQWGLWISGASEILLGWETPYLRGGGEGGSQRASWLQDQWEREVCQEYSCCESQSTQYILALTGRGLGERTDQPPFCTFVFDLSGQRQMVPYKT